MMAHLSRALVILALVAGIAGLPDRATAQAFTDSQKGAIEKIVRDYLIDHPEVLVEALTEYRSRQETAQAESRKGALVRHKDKLFNDSNSPVGANPAGDVTMVEFFDYQCGYCKAVFGDLQKLFKEDGKLRFVYKELPILSPASLVAAKAALAARAQGKYVELHNALMAHRGQLSEEVVMKIAATAGLDTEKLKHDMEDPAVAAAIAANHDLADALDIHGTPGFVIGSQVVPGAIDLPAMKKMIAAERKRS